MSGRLRSWSNSEVAAVLDRAAEISAWPRTHRELAFDGDIDFVPTQRYSAADSDRAWDGAAWIVALAEKVIGGPAGR